MAKEDTKQEPAKQPVKSVAVTIFGLVIALLAVAAVWLLIDHYQGQKVVRQAALDRQAANKAAGVPLDFPSNIVPIYEGLTILSTERGSAESTDGEPMDKWVVNSEIDAEKEPVKDFYTDLLLDKGFSQQHYIGLPTGYGMKYANEECTVDLVVEFRPPGELLKVDITVHRLRN